MESTLPPSPPKRWLNSDFFKQNQFQSHKVCYKDSVWMHILGKTVAAVNFIPAADWNKNKHLVGWHRMKCWKNINLYRYERWMELLSIQPPCMAKRIVNVLEILLKFSGVATGRTRGLYPRKVQFSDLSKSTPVWSRWDWCYIAEMDRMSDNDIRRFRPKVWSGSPN